MISTGQWISQLEIQICICWSQLPLKKVKGLDQKTNQYLVTTTSPLHRVDPAVDCGRWNVVPLLFNGYARFLDIGWNWNMLSCMSIQSILNMLNGWHVWWVCRTWKNWDIFSFQELCTDSCDMELAVHYHAETWCCVFGYAGLSDMTCYSIK